MTTHIPLAPERIRAGSQADLERDGQLLAKLGSLPVLVLWHEGRAWAIEDRCPHMGFPLRQGTVEQGLITCHWHHARFDLASGCTLDPWADDAMAFDVTVDGGDVWVSHRVAPDPVGKLRRRLADGLEHGITLVTAKAALGLLETDPSGAAVVATALDHGARYRAEGWGSGLTVLVAMANVLPHLDPADRPLALVHALAFVSRDTQGHAPRFAESPLESSELSSIRLTDWYRRFVDTRSADASERVLATAVASGAVADAEAMMFTAVTDHVFIDGGHTLDFTNKAFEALALVGDAAAPTLLPALVGQTCAADRSEESSEWRHPRDLAGLAASAVEGLDAARGEGLGHAACRSPTSPGWPGPSSTTTPTRWSVPWWTPSPPAPRPSSSVERSPTPRRCGSCGSTPRTTSATGTRSTTRSRPATPCTRR